MKNERLAPAVMARKYEAAGEFRRAAFYYHKAEMGALGHTFAAQMAAGRARCLEKVPGPRVAVPVTQDTINEEMHECPMCNGNDNVLLGVLGRRVHLRCGACGWEHSFTAPAVLQ